MAGLLDFPPLFNESATTIRGRFDADANAGLSLDDPRWIDTREGSFYFDITQVILLELTRVWDALSVEVPAAAFALFAWGEYLDNHAAIFALTRKAAVSATGTVNFLGTPGTLVGMNTIVSANGATDDSPTIEFATTAPGTIAAALATPTGMTTTPSTTGGTLAAGTYYYQATAYNAFGETVGTPQVSAVTTGTTGSVAVDWANVTGATGYRLYRTSISGGVGQRIYDGSISAYTDTNAAVPGAAGPPTQDTSAGVAIPVAAVDPGTEGNVSAGTIINLESPNPAVTLVSNPAATAGGVEEESDEALRARILLEFQPGGPGTIVDYQRWALTVPGVGKVFVNPVWNGPGTVQVVVMTDTGDPVATSVVTAVQNYLDPTSGTADGKAPPGVTVTVQTPTAVAITVTGTVTYKAGYSIDGSGGTTAQRTAILTALSNYIDGLDVGDDVVYAHVVSCFFQAEGVYNVSGVTVNGGTSDIVITSNPPQVATLNKVGSSFS